MSKVLVTGGAGFIGSHVVAALLGRGHEVRVLDNLSTGRIEQVPDGVPLVTGSILNPRDVREAIQGCDTVVHLAALIDVGESGRQPAQYRATNVEGTERVAVAARAEGVRRVVFASSAAVYGAAEGVVDEGHAVAPLSVYGETKRSGELLLSRPEFQALRPVLLRFFNVYGPGQRGDGGAGGVVARFLHTLRQGAALPMRGDGKQTRDFVYVVDLARSVVAAAELQADVESPINIGSGERAEVIDLAEQLARETGVPLRLLFSPAFEGEIRHSCADITRARLLLGHTTTSLATGLRETVVRTIAGGRAARRAA